MTFSARFITSGESEDDMIKHTHQATRIRRAVNFDGYIVTCRCGALGHLSGMQVAAGWYPADVNWEPTLEQLALKPSTTEAVEPAPPPVHWDALQAALFCALNEEEIARRAEIELGKDMNMGRFAAVAAQMQQLFPDLAKQAQELAEKVGMYLEQRP